MEVELTNNSEVIMEVQYEVMHSAEMMLSGERQSFISLPPLESETFKYTVIPIESGYMSLPVIWVGNESGNYCYIKEALRNILVLPN